MLGSWGCEDLGVGTLADPDVIERRVTHTKQSRSAFAGYRRDGQWPETCSESRRWTARTDGRQSC